MGWGIIPSGGGGGGPVCSEPSVIECLDTPAAILEKMYVVDKDERGISISADSEKLTVTIPPHISFDGYFGLGDGDPISFSAKLSHNAQFKYVYGVSITDTSGVWGDGETCMYALWYDKLAGRTVFRYYDNSGNYSEFANDSWSPPKPGWFSVGKDCDDFVYATYRTRFYRATSSPSSWKGGKRGRIWFSNNYDYIVNFYIYAPVKFIKGVMI